MKWHGQSETKGTIGQQERIQITVKHIKFIL